MSDDLRTLIDRLDHVEAQNRLDAAAIRRLRRDIDATQRQLTRPVPVPLDPNFQTAWGAVPADSDGGECD